MTMEDFEMDFENRHPCLRWNLSEEQETATARDGGYVWLCLPGEGAWSVFVAVPAASMASILVGRADSLVSAVEAADRAHGEAGAEATFMRAAIGRARLVTEVARAEAGPMRGDS